MVDPQLVAGLQRFVNEYRKYTVKNPQMMKPEILDRDKMIRLDCETIDNDDNKIKILIILFAEKNPYTTSIVKMRGLLKYVKEPTDIILITKLPVNKRIQTLFKEFKQHSFFNYLHRHIRFDITNGPFCCPHRILKDDEAKKICEQLCIEPYNLPRIMVDDPQAIKINAKIGDIIEIKTISDFSGNALRYRIVYNESLTQAIDNAVQEEVEEWSREYQAQGREEPEEKEE